MNNISTNGNSFFKWHPSEPPRQNFLLHRQDSPKKKEAKGLMTDETAGAASFLLKYHKNIVYSSINNIKNLLIHHPKNIDINAFSFLFNSLKKNNINFQFKTLNNEQIYYSNDGSDRFIIIEYNNKKLYVETFDRVFDICEYGAKNCDYYLKAQMIDIDYFKSIIHNLDGNIDIYNSYINFYEKYSYKMKAFILARSELIFQPQNYNKKYIIASYSAGCGDASRFGLNRIKIYNIIKEILGDKFLLLKHDQYNYKKMEVNCNALSYSDYLNCIGSGFFMLNLAGKGLGTAYRLNDACLSNSAVISDKVNTIAFQDFPRLDFPWRIHENIIDEEATKTKLKELLINYKEIYNNLIEKQKHWYNDNLNINTYCLPFLELFFN
jgi:hypothetical protein